MAKEGYTRTGKSLKAVRRYYALQNAKKEAEKAKSPADEDKLSKRIAAELKAHQEANQRRPKNEAQSPPAGTTEATGQVINMPQGGISTFGLAKTERSNLPEGIVMSPKQSGPVFTTAEPVNTAAKITVDTAKTIKSYKSNRSTGNSYRYTDTDRTSASFEDYCTGAIICEALVFLLTFLYSFIENSVATSAWKQEIDVEVKWMGYTSIFVLVSTIYWIYKHNQFFHAVLSLVIMILSAVSSVILLATSRNYPRAGVVDSGHKSVFDMDVQIVFTLIISYFVLQLFMIALMILHVIGLLSRQVLERSGRTEYQEGNMITTGQQA